MLSNSKSIPPWIRWIRDLQAVASNGLEYSTNPFDRSRYVAVRRTANQIAAAMSTTPLDVIAAIYDREAGPATPKIGVRAGVFRGDEILLVQEAEDNCWSLPGGWVDQNESPSEAIQREVQEEAGYGISVMKLAAVWDRDRHGHPPHPWHIYKLVFVASVEAEGRALGDETIAAQFFDEHSLPRLSLTRVTDAQIVRLFEHHRNPAMPTEFD